MERGERIRQRKGRKRKGRAKNDKKKKKTINNPTKVWRYFGKNKRVITINGVEKIV